MGHGTEMDQWTDTSLAAGDEAHSGTSLARRTPPIHSSFPEWLSDQQGS